MIPDNVTLIVKAPNQQIDDQNVECLSSWTVRELKGHLSEVYPNKPSTDEQKIIYSGQLLEDSAVLRDVLRSYSAQLAHTMHLVCTPRHKPAPGGTGQEGLRRRTVPEATPDPPPRTEPPRPETQQNDQNHTAEMHRYMSSLATNYGRVPPHPAGYMPAHVGDPAGYMPAHVGDPAAMQGHMMMMQHAYMQYMQQYANMWQAGHAVPGAQPIANTEVPQQPVGQPAAPPAAPADEPEERRDWLEHVYAGSRLAVLFCLVYLYSSPFRLLLVVMLAAAGYLHQVGFFRDLGLNAAPANPPNPLNPPNPPNPQEPHGTDPPPEAEAPAPAPEVPPANVDPGNHQSLLAVTWMIFTSFFASLVPEIHQ